MLRDRVVLDDVIFENQCRWFPPEARLLNKIFHEPVPDVVEPERLIEFRCLCRKYRHRKYGPLVCDRCSTPTQERVVYRVPDKWTKQDVLRFKFEKGV